MKSEHLSGHDGIAKSKRTRVAKQKTDPDCRSASINVVRSGDWMPAEELLEAAKTVLGDGKDVTLNLDKIEHLDASALQILLALDTEQKMHGRRLQLVNISASLRQWFEYSGAAVCFFMTEQKSNE